MGWLNKLFNLDATLFKTDTQKDADDSKKQAKNRLKLVLMHDRRQLSPAMMSQMRDELVEVICKYVEIDKEALELNFESESNTIALVANIPVVRAKPEGENAFVAVKPAEGEKKAAVNETEASPFANAEKLEKAVKTPPDEEKALEELVKQSANPEKPKNHAAS
ncbi:MAG: cell division topological specificity factor MinE [Candidatus Melainabacteria bacterium]